MKKPSSALKIIRVSQLISYWAGLIFCYAFLVFFVTALFGMISGSPNTHPWILSILLVIFIASGLTALFSLAVIVTTILITLMTTILFYLKYSLGYLLTTILHFGLCIAGIQLLPGFLKGIPLGFLVAGFVLVLKYILAFVPETQYQKPESRLFMKSDRQRVD